MTRDELHARLLTTFLGELDEQVGELNEQLLGLEQDPRDAQRLKALFRSAHTIKGAARIVGLDVIEAACHALEEYFSQLRDARIAFDAAHAETLFAAVDALADAQRRIAAQQPLADAEVASVPARLAQLGAQPDASPATPRRAPSAGRTERPQRQPTPPAPAPEPAPRTEPEPVPPPQQRGAAAGGPAERPDTDARAPETIRVDAEKVEALHNRAGELIVAATRVDDRMAEVAELRDWIEEWVSSHRANGDERFERLRTSYGQLARALRDDVHALRRIAGNTGAAVLELRLRPIADAFEALPRAARDVAAQSGKHVRVEIDGGDVQADRLVVDALREPLLHLVRNAVDHGIETPAERRGAGKAEAGTIRIAAQLKEGRIILTVSDDGRGLDAAALRGRMQQRGETAPATDRDLARALLAGGMTTRGAATTISGRGVGLDLVRAGVERIRGSVNVRWKAGEGTQFIIESPPSPTTLRAVLVTCGTQILGLPSLHVDRLLSVADDEIRMIDGRAVFIAGDEAVPLVPLASVLGSPLPPPRPANRRRIVLIHVADRRLGVIVDDFLAEQDLVVRPLEGAAARVPHIGGGALLASGRIALVLHLPSVINSGLKAGAAELPGRPQDETERRPRVLVVDDSITTRTLEQSVLEAAGFEVATAVDGVDGWRKLQETGADLVVADVEMPRMDGFSLCETIRGSDRFRELPVILVTALEAPEHRERGLEAGADAYLTKAAFDQETLLDTIRQLLD
jgi:two-component system, chemotaxis family, sensor kinase CheA